VVGVILILLVNPVKVLVFLIIFVVIQQFEGNIIYPHVVGNSVGLSGIWVLVSLTVGGSLFGIMGMVVFIPLVSVLYAFLREYIYGILKDKGLVDEDYKLLVGRKKDGPDSKEESELKGESESKKETASKKILEPEDDSDEDVAESEDDTDDGGSIESEQTVKEEKPAATQNRKNQNHKQQRKNRKR
jgi:hypothetical protein